MFRIIGTTLALGLGTALAVSADPIRVTDITVEADLSGMENNALDYWPELEADLLSAIAAKTATFTGTVPFEVRVQIESVSLNGSALLSDDGEFNHIRGTVSAYPENNPVAQQSFPIEMIAFTGTPDFASPDAIVIPPFEGEFYMALVDAFATEAAARLAMLDSNAPAPAIPERSSSGGSAVPDAETGEDTDTDTDTDTGPVDDQPDVDAEVDADADADAEADGTEG